MTREMKFHAVEEFVRSVSETRGESSERRRKIFLWDDGGNLVSGDWLQWLPLIIQLLEIIAEWLADESLGHESQDLCSAVAAMPTAEQLRDLIATLNTKGE